MAKKTHASFSSVKQKEKCDCGCGKWHKGHGSMGCIYGLGFIGAVIYNISIATGFWMGVLGILKAIVWPAFLVYQAMKFLGA